MTVTTEAPLSTNQEPQIKPEPAVPVATTESLSTAPIDNTPFSQEEQDTLAKIMENIQKPPEPNGENINSTNFSTLEQKSPAQNPLDVLLTQVPQREQPETPPEQHQAKFVRKSVFQRLISRFGAFLNRIRRK